LRRRSLRAARSGVRKMNRLLRDSSDGMIERNGHWEGCWKEPGHHDCAIRLVEGFKRRFEAAHVARVEDLGGEARCVRVPRHWRPGDIVRLVRVEESIESRETTPERLVSSGMHV
jgi:hypothetical protein